MAVSQKSRVHTPRVPRRRETGRGKRRRRGKNVLYYIIIFIFLLAAGVYLSLTVFFKVEVIEAAETSEISDAGNASRLDSEKIPEYKNQAYSAEEIIAASGVKTGENLFMIDTKGAGDRILAKFPYIASVNVRPRIPNAVHIDYSLLKAEGALEFEGEYLLITRDGKVLERGLVFIPEDVPLIKGVNAGDAMPGERLYMGKDAEASAEARITRIDDLLREDGDIDRNALNREKETLSRNLSRSRAVSEAMVMLEYLYKAIEETGFSEITNVDLSDPYNMKVVYENRLLLNLGTESELVAKLVFLREMIESELSPDAEGLISAANIGNRSIVFSAMPVKDAIEGIRQERQTSIFDGDIWDKPA